LCSPLTVPTAVFDSFSVLFLTPHSRLRRNLRHRRELLGRGPGARGPQSPPFHVWTAMWCSLPTVLLPVLDGRSVVSLVDTTTTTGASPDPGRLRRLWVLPRPVVPNMLRAARLHGERTTLAVLGGSGTAGPDCLAVVRRDEEWMRDPQPSALWPPGPSTHPTTCSRPTTSPSSGTLRAAPRHRAALIHPQHLRSSGTWAPEALESGGRQHCATTSPHFAPARTHRCHEGRREGGLGQAH